MTLAKVCLRFDIMSSLVQQRRNWLGGREPQPSPLVFGQMRSWGALATAHLCELMGKAVGLAWCVGARRVDVCWGVMGEVGEGYCWAPLDPLGVDSINNKS